MIPYVAKGDKFKPDADIENKVRESANDYMRRKLVNAPPGGSRQGVWVPARNDVGEAIPAFTPVILEGVVNDPIQTKYGTATKEFAAPRIYKAKRIKSECANESTPNISTRFYAIFQQPVPVDAVADAMILGESLVWMPDIYSEWFDYIADIGGKRNIVTPEGTLPIAWLSDSVEDAEYGQGRWGLMWFGPQQPEGFWAIVTNATASAGNGNKPNSFDWVEGIPAIGGGIVAKTGGRTGVSSQGEPAYNVNGAGVTDGTAVYLRPGRFWFRDSAETTPATCPDVDRETLEGESATEWPDVVREWVFESAGSSCSANCIPILVPGDDGPVTAYLRRPRTGALP